MRSKHNTIADEFRVAEVELIYKNKRPYNERLAVRSSKDAFQLLRAAWDLNKMDLQEQFKILLLDTANRCLGISNISTGGIAGCIIDPRLVFSTALKAKASSLILAHNHPSGNLTPSTSDVRLTERLIEGGKILEIAVSDHIIMTTGAYCSLSDDGLIPV